MSVDDGGLASIKGLAIDVTDLWGMSGEGTSINASCFCDECTSFLTGKGVKLAAFQNFPNPFALVLHAQETSMSFIDNFEMDESPASLVGKSKLRGFGGAFNDSQAEIAAQDLLKYMKARHEMVVDGLREIFRLVKEAAPQIAESLDRIIVAEGTNYSWPAGFFLKDLTATNELIDETWIGPAEAIPKVHGNFRYLTSTRSTYFINAFLEIAANAQNPRIRATTGLARMPEQAVRRLVQNRGITAAARLVNNLFALGLAAEDPIEGVQFRGFVRPALDADLVNALANRLNIAPSPYENEAGDADPQSSAHLQALLRAMRARAGEAHVPEAED